jgi:hypothetical protein
MRISDFNGRFWFISIFLDFLLDTRRLQRTWTLSDTMKGRDLDGLPSRHLNYNRRLWFYISSFILFGAAFWLLQPHFPYGTEPSNPKSPTYNHILAPRENVWGELADEEIWALQDFLYKGPNDLGLTEPRGSFNLG